MEQLIKEVVSAETFEAEVRQSELPVILAVTSPFCPACDPIRPFVEELALMTQGHFQIVTIDPLDDGFNYKLIRKEMIEKHGIDIMPVLLFYLNGEQFEKPIVGPENIIMFASSVADTLFRMHTGGPVACAGETSKVPTP